MADIQPVTDPAATPAKKDHVADAKATFKTHNTEENRAKAKKYFGIFKKFKVLLKF